MNSSYLVRVLGLGSRNERSLLKYRFENLPPRINIPQAISVLLSPLQWPKRAKKNPSSNKTTAAPDSTVHDLESWRESFIRCSSTNKKCEIKK